MTDPVPRPAPRGAGSSEFLTSVRRAGRVVVQSIGTASAPLRPVPEFLIIGVKRSGSTSLFRYLETHPGVAPLFPTSKFPLMRENQKGVHYFDSNSQRSPAWYRGHFLTGATRRRRGQIAGEASPYYLFHPRAADRAFALVPDAKIIVLLRDPVDRTYSHWSEQRRNGVEPLSFVEALAAERERVGDAEAALRDGRIRTSFAHEQQTYAAQSHYADSLQRWIDCFGRQRILIARSEDLYTETQATFDTVTDFLGLARHRLANVEPWNAAATSPMGDEVRRDLEARFADDRAKVFDMTGIQWSSI